MKEFVVTVLMIAFTFVNGLSIQRQFHDRRSKPLDENQIDAAHGIYSDIRYAPHDYRKRSFLKANQWQKNAEGKYVIPYAFKEEDFLLSEKNNIEAAVKDMNEYLYCSYDIWVPYDSQKHTTYVRFTKQEGCWSYLGDYSKFLNPSTHQDISIGDGCNHRGIIQHEMMHAMGFKHEQARSDRDDYITVHWNNIPFDAMKNFLKISAEKFDESIAIHKFDYDSLMLYGYKDFSWTGEPTITSKFPLIKKSEDLGQRVAPSTGDTKELHTLFKCEGRQWTLLDQVCYGAKAGTEATLTLEKSGVIKKIGFVHVSGGLTCNSNLYSQTNWGCSGYFEPDYRFMTVVTDPQNSIIFPQSATAITYEIFRTQKKAVSLPGFNLNSESIILNGNYDGTKGEKLKLYYLEDLIASTWSWNNAGTHCVTVWLEY